MSLHILIIRLNMNTEHELVHSMGRLRAVRRTGPFSRTGAAGALRRASTAVRSVVEADSIYYFNRTSSNMARTCRGL